MTMRLANIEHVKDTYDYFCKVRDLSSEVSRNGSEGFHVAEDENEKTLFKINQPSSLHILYGTMQNVAQILENYGTELLADNVRYFGMVREKLHEHIVKGLRVELASNVQAANGDFKAGEVPFWIQGNGPARWMGVYVGAFFFSSQFYFPDTSYESACSQLYVKIAYKLRAILDNADDIVNELDIKSLDFVPLKEWLRNYLYEAFKTDPYRLVPTTYKIKSPAS